MPAFMFLRICEDCSYKNSSMKSVRAVITWEVSGGGGWGGAGVPYERCGDARRLA